MPSDAAIAVPLTDLLRKGQPNKLRRGEAQVRAYETPKRVVTERPILHLMDNTKQFILRTDASDAGIGVILLQEHGERPFPIAFASKELSPRERRFSAIEKECLAIVWGVRRFTINVCGREFVLQTDHVGGGNVYHNPHAIN